MAARCLNRVRLGGGSEERVFSQGEILAHRQQVRRRQSSCDRGRGAYATAAGLPGTANPDCLSGSNRAAPGRAAEATADPPSYPAARKAGNCRSSFGPFHARDWQAPPYWATWATEKTPAQLRRGRLQTVGIKLFSEEPNPANGHCSRHRLSSTSNLQSHRNHHESLSKKMSLF